MCQEVQEQKPWLSGTEDGRVGGSCVPASSANVTAAGGGDPWKMLHPWTTVATRQQHTLISLRRYRRNRFHNGRQKTPAFAHLGGMASAVQRMPTALDAKPLQHHSSKPKLSTVGSLLAGTVAGATEASITYPFEWAKTRSQLPSALAADGLRNPIRLLWRTANAEGLGVIYTGCGALVVGTAAKAGVRFLTFDSVQSLLADADGKLDAKWRVVAGMAAGAMEAILAVTPTERIKTALIDDARGANRFTSASDATVAVLREQGIAGLYRGLSSTIIKQSATSAVRMGLYSTLKDVYSEQTGKKANSTVVSFTLGAIAGTGTVYATQPFDTIKTRAQGAKGESLATAIRNVLAENGVRGFWKGSSMRLGRLVLSGGIVFSVYEQISGVLRGLI